MRQLARRVTGEAGTAGRQRLTGGVLRRMAGRTHQCQQALPIKGLSEKGTSPGWLARGRLVAGHQNNG